MTPATPPPPAETQDTAAPLYMYAVACELSSILCMHAFFGHAMRECPRGSPSSSSSSVASVLPPATPSSVVLLAGHATSVDTNDDAPLFPVQSRTGADYRQRP